jgi:hypothetical protein
MDNLAVTQADEDAANGWADTIGRLGGVYLDTGQRAGLACAFAAHRLTQSDALQTDALDFGNELIFACAGLRHAPVETEAVFSVTWDGFPFDVTISSALQEQSK